ncbi:MAG: SDR family oxidoreductase [Bacteroidota bacterium]
MDLNLKNKNALVCGGSRGLGEASAIELALLGANVFLLARNKERLKKVLNKLDTSQGQQHGFITADLSEGPTVLKEKIDKIIARKNIHILINNTGGPKGGNLQNATAEQFLEAFNNHILTAHNMVKWLKSGMVADQYGRIVNIVSTSVRQPIKGLAVSNVTRGAMASWAKTLSMELASTGITVNNVLPGTTKTERVDEILLSRQKLYGYTPEESVNSMLLEIPFGRFATPEEIGAVVAFIASPAASYITGASIPVDGGKIKSI